LPVAAASSAITAGDIIVTSGTAGYVAQGAADGDVIRGVAMADVASPSANGGLSVLVDCSPLSVYEYPPDAGSVTAALAGKTCDIGGARSVKISTSADDNIYIVAANVTDNLMLVQFKINATFTGVA